ncbi:MAG: galactokinase [Pseudolysinimonas sp.]|uniref:galactokinase n=1 Tax=Pseudolysinimonas sp. TaxID=2680009 RepID=UPI0032671BA4
MSDIRDDATELFTAITGRTPDGLWSAPGRVNLIGEHTDYNQGFVLPFAIDRRTVVAAGLREDAVIRVASTFSTGVVELPLAELDGVRGQMDWADYPLGVAWGLGRSGADLAAVPGVDLVIDSTVPVGAGLSSSAAIECAVAVALDELWRLGMSRPALARIGQLAENEFVGAPTGIMDQSASLLGRPDAAVFLDCRSLEVELVDLGLAAAGLTVLVMDTRVAHAHSTGGYGERRASCERGAATLGVSSLREIGIQDLDRARELLDDVTFRRVRHVVTENQRVLDTVRALRENGPLAIGDLLDASHRSLRDDFEVSVPELDLAVETALENGAIGARMTGGGFGGSAIALAPLDAVSRIQVALDGAFAEHGFTNPEVFTVTPSTGAERDS